MNPPDAHEQPTVHRRYRYRIYPTAAQQSSLNEQLAFACDLYNAALEQRKDAWKRGRSVSYYDQTRELTHVRADSESPRMAVTAQRSALKRLDRAFAAFFGRCGGKGGAPGHPRFRSMSRYDSLTLVNGDGASCCDSLRIVGVGSIRVRWHREIPEGAQIKEVTVKRSNGRWYASFVVVLLPPDALPATGHDVGVDIGVTTFAALSNGEMVEGIAKNSSGLRRAQRKVARRKKGSNRRRKAALLLARQHEREANRRKDHLHKTSRRLVNDFDMIAVEGLVVRNMMRSAAGTIEAPGKNVAQKRGLNRAISEQGWSTFRTMLAYKAEEAGRHLIVVPPMYTSQTCHECGVVDAGSRKGTVFRCTSCHHEDHADINAAKNILRLGRSLQAPTVGEESVPLPENALGASPT